MAGWYATAEVMRGDQLIAGCDGDIPLARSQGRSSVEWGMLVVVSCGEVSLCLFLGLSKVRYPRPSLEPHHFLCLSRHSTLPDTTQGGLVLHHEYWNHSCQSGFIDCSRSSLPI